MGWFSFPGLGSYAIRKAYRSGAVIIDVRSGIEYDQGRIPDSVNIPVDRLSLNLPRIKAMKAGVICCCNSGARSAQAVHYLRQQGINNVYDGGSWERLARTIRK